MKEHLTAQDIMVPRGKKVAHINNLPPATEFASFLVGELISALYYTDNVKTQVCCFDVPAAAI